MFSLSGFVNFLSTFVQRRVQSIPSIPAYLYNVLPRRILSRLHYLVALGVARVFRDRSIRIVDLGSGTGSLLLNLARFGYGYLVGIDISRTMCRIARLNALLERLYSHVDFIVGDVHNLPFRSRSINCILSTGTLHHIRRPHVLFSEVLRVLCRGGLALIYEFSYDVSFSEALASARKLQITPLLIKTLPILHGIPRREFIDGFIASALRACCRNKYEVSFDGIVTLVKLSYG